MRLLLKIHVEETLLKNSFINGFFLKEFPKVISEIFNGDIEGGFLKTNENADLVLCDASSEKAYDP